MKSGALFAATVAALALACGSSDRTELADGDLSVNTTGLAFPDTEVGGLTRQTISLYQTGRVDRDVPTRIEGQGFETAELVTVPAGRPGELQILFRPTDAGMNTAWLHLYSHGQDVVVTLYGVGTAAQSSSATVGGR